MMAGLSAPTQGTVSSELFPETTSGVSIKKVAKQFKQGSVLSRVHFNS